MNFINRTRKATVAAVAAGVAMWMARGSGGMSQTDWSMLVGTIVVTWVMTFMAKNKAA